MINKSISISLQVSYLSDFAQLLFTWMIPHADDFGRLPGDPNVVKALVVPMKKQTTKEVSKALQEMVEAGLIYWYEVDKEQVIELIKFEDHQTGLNKRTKSRFPERPISNSGEILRNSEKFPSNLTELNGTEQKGTEQKDEPVPYAEVIDCLNAKAEKEYKSTTAKTQECIRARWNEGFRLSDFKRVIDIKTAEWKGTKDDKYLRPETLFGTKFEGYLNQKEGINSRAAPRDKPGRPSRADTRDWENI